VQSHRDWLALVEVSGPFLSLPVLRATWPSLDALDKPAREALRTAHTLWLDDPAAGQAAWIDHVLFALLDWTGAVHRASNADLTQFAVDVPEHETTLRPDFVLMPPGEDEGKPGTAVVLGSICRPGQAPNPTHPDDHWSATPADRLARLCRTHEVELASSRRPLVDPRLGATGRGHHPRHLRRDLVGGRRRTRRRPRVLLHPGPIPLLRRPRDERLVPFCGRAWTPKRTSPRPWAAKSVRAVELLVAAIGRADTEARAAARRVSPPSPRTTSTVARSPS